MSKRYIFRTTRETSFLEAILDAVAEKDRAKYIRELLIKGLGISPTPSVVQMSYNCQTNVEQMSDKESTNVVQMSDIVQIEDIPKKPKKNISSFI
jgi:hypothetical protein